MKKILSYIIIFTAFTLSITSCNKESVSNVNDSNLTGNFLQLEWVEAGSGTTVNSGLQYFGGSTILYPSDHTADTATYTVTLNGPNPLSTDLKVSLVTDWTLLNVNYANDSTVYEKMPDSLYKFLNTEVTIKAGSRTATAKVVFYPSKINTKKNYMVPLTVTNSSNILISKNFGQLYFHTIGNPIAGKYTWDFERRNNELGTGAPAGGSFTGEEITFVPVTTKQIHVPTGYFVQPNYLIAFKDNNGVLSDFTAEIEPSELAGAFTNNGITIVSKPAITAVKISGKYKFTIKYVVFNGSAYRNCIDFYTQQ